MLFSNLYNVGHHSRCRMNRLHHPSIVGVMALLLMYSLQPISSWAWRAKTDNVIQAGNKLYQYCLLLSSVPSWWQPKQKGSLPGNGSTTRPWSFILIDIWGAASIRAFIHPGCVTLTQCTWTIFGGVRKMKKGLASTSQHKKEFSF